MRIQNTISSIANAICRFCVKGLLVSRIPSLLQRRYWHLLSQSVRLAQFSFCTCFRVSSHVMGMLRNLTAAAAQMMSEMDASLERQLLALKFALCPCAGPGGKPATLAMLEARLGKPVTTGSQGTRFRNPS